MSVLFGTWPPSFARDRPKAPKRTSPFTNVPDRFVIRTGLSWLTPLLFYISFGIHLLHSALSVLYLAVTYLWIETSVQPVSPATIRLNKNISRDVQKRTDDDGCCRSVLSFAGWTTCRRFHFNFVTGNAVWRNRSLYTWVSLNLFAHVLECAHVAGVVFNVQFFWKAKSLLSSVFFSFLFEDGHIHFRCSRKSLKYLFKSTNIYFFILLT